MKTISIMPHPAKSTKVSFPYKGGIHSFRLEQIIRLQSVSNYTYIFTTDAKPILMATVLSAYEPVLEPLGFVRTHRSHLVNRKHISGIQEANEIVMADASVIEISRRKRKDVLKVLSTSPQAA
jgi:two-component system LytT family response regulator